MLPLWLGAPFSGWQVPFFFAAAAAIPHPELDKERKGREAREGTGKGRVFAEQWSPNS